MNNHAAALADALREALDALALFSDSNNTCADAETAARAALAAYDAGNAAPTPSVDSWRYQQQPDGLRIVNQRGAVCEMLAGYQQTREQDARRIVACVNACAGTSTERLESGNYGIIQTRHEAPFPYTGTPADPCAARVAELRSEGMTHGDACAVAEAEGLDS